MKLFLFCEADADARIVSGLVDRVLRAEAPAWIGETLDAHPEAVREWVGDGRGRPFFDLHHLSESAQRLGVRVPHGHFDGKRGAAGALSARTAMYIVRKLLKEEAAPGDAAMLFVWDMDDQGDERRLGLGQAREEASRLVSFRFVIGCPDMEREAWVLAGFEPESAAEEQELDALRGELGFCPCKDAHRLRDKDDGAVRSLKRVVRVLTRHDSGRQESCWSRVPLEQLRESGEGSGLRAFLDEVRERVVDLCVGRAAGR